MNTDDLPSTTPKERIERITGFLARIWSGMTQPQRIWTVIWSVVAVFSLFVMWGAGAFEPAEPTEFERCVEDVMDSVEETEDEYRDHGPLHNWFNGGAYREGPIVDSGDVMWEAQERYFQWEKDSGVASTVIGVNESFDVEAYVREECEELYG